MITQERLKSVLHCTLDGVVTHIKLGTKWHGREVGSLHHTGYLVHTVDGKQYNLHRLVFLYWHGFLPVMVDHYDQNKTNNAISNLVPSDVKHNGRNRKSNSNNKSGYTGVVWDKRRSRWKAQIKYNGKQISLGNFVNIEDAVACRKKKEQELGFCLNHGSK